MAGGAPSGGSTNTVQKSDPWSGQQPYLTEGFQKAEDLYLNTPPPQLYSGQTVPNFSPETQTGLDLATMRALNGSPTQDAANSQLTNTMNDNYLYGNPGFNAAVQAATNQILPQVGSTFEQSGRMNSGLANVAQTQAVSDAFANQYENERNNQLKATVAAPSVEGQDYTDFNNLVNIGQQYQGQTGAQEADAANRYDYNQNIMQSQLANYMNAIQGNYGGTTTSSSTTSQNSGGSGIMQGLGGLLTVADMFGSGGGLSSILGGGAGLLGAFF